MTLTRGQKLKLSQLTPSQDLEIGINCQHSHGATIDITCFGVDDNSKLTDERYMIFYNQTSSPNGEIVQLGRSGSELDRFSVSLQRLPSHVRRLVFTATLDGNGDMSQLTSGYIRISANGRELERYSFSGADFVKEKAIIIAEIYFKSEWRFSIVGQGFNGGLSALLKHFGGEEDTSSQSQQPQQSYSPAQSISVAPQSSSVTTRPTTKNLLSKFGFKIGSETVENEIPVDPNSALGRFQREHNLGTETIGQPCHPLTDKIFTH
ncbi:tellurium resistance TerZ family protein [bacterium]|nr:tellurium resistance TerZ family protein [bacterium]